MILGATSGWAHPGCGIATDASGSVYIVSGPRILKVTPDGTGQVIVHDTRAEHFYQLHHIQRTPDGGLVTASDLGDVVWRFSAEGQLTRFYPPPNSDRALRVGSGGDPFAVDARGTVYAVNSVQDHFTQVLTVEPDGRISVLAGSDWGYADGAGPAARFGDLHSGSMVVAADGALLITDDRTRVRRVSPAGEVRTLAGGERPGFADGPGPQARFNGAAGLAVNADGRILVAESTGRIREVSPAGQVRTLAGTGASGGRDGHADQATFQEPTGVAWTPDGSVLIYESQLVRIRKLKGGQVSTLFRESPPK